MRKTSGFTLVELIAVIFIMGIIGVATSKFLVFGTTLYIEATDRQHVLSKSRFLVERLTRELRETVPNSVRVSSDSRCIGYVPIKASGAYRTDTAAQVPPIDPNSGASMDVISWKGNYSTNDSVYIYPTRSNDIYISKSKVATISSVTGTSPNLQFSLSFSNSDNFFAEGSPQNRYYTASNSVTWCVYNNNMYRYESNGISPFMFSARSIARIGVLMSEGLTNTIPSEAPFTYRSGALYRNSVVNMYFEFNANQSENMFFNQEVHIANVP
jgi:MSHA biogenesis protein MshO